MKTFYTNLRKSRNPFIRWGMGQGQRIFAEYEARFHFSNPNASPVLIYQMGKVGSQTIYRSLRNSGLRKNVFFVHFLSGDLGYHKKLHLDAGINPVPYNLELGIALRKRLHLADPKIRYKIITMVRDPIALKISGIFQVPELFSKELKNESGLIDRARARSFIASELGSPDAFDYIFSWFDKELRTVFGVDVFAEPFDPGAGWKIYNGCNADVLLIRLEDLSRAGESIISDFLDVPSKITLANSNRRSDTDEAESYRYVKNNISVDRALCEGIYSSRFARHFYSEQEIEKMIKKWAHHEKCPSKSGC